MDTEIYIINDRGNFLCFIDIPARYGLFHVQQWNFESWNEPSPHAFDSLNMTIQGGMIHYEIV